MRLFVAIEFPEEVLNELQRIQNELRGVAKRGRFVARANLHLTLQFLGEVSAQQVGPILQALQTGAGRRKEISLALKNIGSFGGASPYRVVWAGIEGGMADLAALQKDLAVSLASVGFPLENRPYQPHITLGRDVEFPGEAPFKTSSKSLNPAAFSVNQFALKESRTENGRLVYRTLQEFAFA